MIYLNANYQQIKTENSIIGYIFWAIMFPLLFLLSFSNSFANEQGINTNETGIIALSRSLKCNGSGLRTQKNVIEIIVVGDAEGLRCIIKITDALIRISNPYDGYVCVSRSKSKPAFLIRDENDRRVRNVRNYSKHLRDAKEIASQTGWPINIIYVHTAGGPPKANKKCKKASLS